MTTKAKKASRYQAVRLHHDDFVRVEQLLALVARVGWAGIGSKRTTPVTLGSVTAEAVAHLLSVAEKKPPK